MEDAFAMNDQIKKVNTIWNWKSCGQFYEASTIVNYGSRVVLTNKLLIFTTLETQILIVGPL